jgi:outer membrane protein assembly factor BamB
VASGPDATHALRARDGKRVWRFADGKYANPVVADDKRVYITGRAHEYALAPRKKGAGKR